MKILSCDIAILGGGLAGGLIALALAKRRPEVKFMLVEEEDSFGGNHVWSFFSEDIEPANRWLTAPLVTYGWSGYDVAFPGHRRTLDAIYYSIESERFDAVIREVIHPDNLISGCKILANNHHAAVLADGRRVEAKAIIDARGAGDLSLLDIGYQKFVGQELELAEPHGITRPMIMDATVRQHDGYRFVYCLPFGPCRMFVEDTYYSEDADLDKDVLVARIADYAKGRGWKVDRVLRNEFGVLPVSMDGDFEGYWNSGGKAMAKAGVRAGLFHPTTGYSLPDAVRTAVMVAELTDLSGPALHATMHEYAATRWRQGRFYRMIDKMLFRAAQPDERYKVLERFYRLDPKLIGRFYAGRSTIADKMRILSGKPPVPISRALAALGETA